MESQIALLRSIVRGEEPASAENLKRAFNEDVLSRHAIHTQSLSTETTLNALSHEIERLQTDIDRRKEQIRRIQEHVEKEAGRVQNSDPKTTTSSGPPPNLDKLKHVVRRLADEYLEQLGLGDSDEIMRVLWKLIEVTLRNEQLIVPSDLRIVQFLIDEGLVRNEAVGSHKVRIRIH